MRGILPVRAKAAAFEIIRHLGQLHRTGKARAGGRLDKKSLRLVQGVKVCEQMLVRHREAAADHLLDRLPHKTRRAADGEAVRRGAARQANILHADLILQATGEAEQHARRFHRLGKVDMRRVAELLLQAKADTARRAADAAGNVNEQRVLVVHRDVLRGELRLEPPRSHSVAEEEVDRVFIVDKIAFRVLRRALAALLHGVGVVRAVFEHRYALCAQQVLFPLPRVRAHVDRDSVAERRAHDADAQPQIARRTDVQLILREKVAERARGKHAVVVARLDQPVRKR